MGTENDDLGAGIRAYVPAGQPGFDRIFLGLYTTTYNSGLQSRIERLTITDIGTVGIGTTSPDAMLTVKGDIHTREVKVDMNGSVAGDYVFQEDYDLLSLEDLESYINKNSHLPEVPSVSEMEANGLNLKEMNLILLKKVEELTLHIIEINKRMQTLERQNVDHERELERLKGKSD